jgi:hypothetical protein
MGLLIVRGWRAFYRHIYTVYGVTPEHYRALYLAQLGRCFVCQKAKGMHPDDPKGAGSQRLGIDHNHAYGSRREAVRALTCTLGDKSCNRILGWLTYEGLERARIVLREMPAQAVLRQLDAGPISDEDLTGMMLHERD